jgi:hypothetical protein
MGNEKAQVRKKQLFTYMVSPFYKKKPAITSQEPANY